MAQARDHDNQRNIVLRNELSLLLVAPQDFPILAAANKIRRIQGGFKSEADKMEEYDRWFSEYIYLIEHNFLLRLVIFGEYYLVDLFLKAWGLTPRERGECFSLRDEILARLLQSSSLMPLKPLKPSTTQPLNNQVLSEVLYFLDHHAESNQRERISALRQEYQRLFIQYHQEQRQIHRAFTIQMVGICKTIASDHQIPIDIRNRFESLGQEIQKELHVLMQDEVANPPEALEDHVAQMNEMLRLTQRATVGMRTLFEGSDVKVQPYRHVFEDNVQISEQKNKKSKERLLPILRSLSAEMERLHATDEVDMAPEILNVVTATLAILPKETLSRDEMSLLNQTIFELKKNQDNFLNASIEEQRKLIAQTIHHLDISIEFFAKIPDSEEVIEKLEGMKAMFTLRLAEAPHEPLPPPPEVIAEPIVSPIHQPHVTASLRDQLHHMRVEHEEVKESELEAFSDTIAESRESLKKSVLRVFKSKKELSGVLKKEAFEPLMCVVESLKAENYMKVSKSSLHELIAIKDTLEDGENTIIGNLLASLNEAFPEAFKPRNGHANA